MKSRDLCLQFSAIHIELVLVEQPPFAALHLQLKLVPLDQKRIQNTHVRRVPGAITFVNSTK
jgi:hypothetical protein